MGVPWDWKVPEHILFLNVIFCLEIFKEILRKMNVHT